jgi:hypothetical protein
MKLGDLDTMDRMDALRGLAEQLKFRLPRPLACTPSIFFLISQETPSLLANIELQLQYHSPVESTNHMLLQQFLLPLLQQLHFLFRIFARLLFNHLNE